MIIHVTVMAHLNLFCGLYNDGLFPLYVNRDKQCGTCLIAIQTENSGACANTLMIIIYILFFLTI